MLSDFQATLKLVCEAIEEASFLAIDGEFTGLNHAGLSHCAMFDTPEERYHKVIQGSSDFLLIQFGLCAFSYDGNKKQYTAKPFNFYIFPRPYSRSSPDLRFSCQSSSLEFLASQGFDFNKMIREGIPYLTPVHEAKVREATIKKHEVFSSPSFTSPAGVASDPGINKGPVIIPPEQQEYIDTVCAQVEKFLEKNEEEHISLAPCTAFQRKLTYQTVNAKFSGEVHLQTKTGDKKERYIVVTKVQGEEAMKKIEQEKHAADLAEIDAAVGFTHVIKKISQSGKLVVGHNILLDITHTIHQFMYPLPHDYTEFKSMCRSIFPRLVDTKLMANTQPFKEKIYNSGLEGLTKITEMEPFTKPEVVVAEDFDCSYDKKESLHEAGYDAFLTGRCFIALSNFLGKCQDPPADRIPSKSPLLEPFVNKIYMMRPFDIPYMDLAGPDLNPPREHVFHISFPEDWRILDINSLFSAFGNIQIGWIDECSAYVALYNRAGADLVLKALCQKGAAYRIMSYQTYKQQVKWNTKMVYKRAHSNGSDTPTAGNITQAGSHEQQGSEKERRMSDQTPGKIKRSLSQENDEPQNKKLKVTDTVETATNSTPESTPEKMDELEPPKKMTYAEITKSGEKNKNKMFAEPQDW